jgi:hypothetical protein
MHSNVDVNRGDRPTLAALTVGQQRIAVLPRPGSEGRTTIECRPEWRDSIVWDNATQSRSLVIQTPRP